MPDLTLSHESREMIRTIADHISLLGIYCLFVSLIVFGPMIGTHWSIWWMIIPVFFHAVIIMQQSGRIVTTRKYTEQKARLEIEAEVLRALVKFEAIQRSKIEKAKKEAAGKN